MKYPVLAATLVAIFLNSSCAPVDGPIYTNSPPGPLPAGVVQKGSLGNKKLIRDASLVALASLVAEGHKPDPNHVEFDPYVVTQPYGMTGGRKWTERWFFHVGAERVPVTIDFTEEGAGAANYVVRN